MSMKTKKVYSSGSPIQTRILAEKLAEDISKIRKRKAFLIGLEGDLGGGKTTFVQGLAKGLKIKQKILSPTFVIYRKIQIPKSKCQIKSKIQNPKFQNFYHIDCYRIKKPKELLTLNFQDIISNPKNIVCIEWADKVKKILPKDILWIKFELKGKDRRKIIFIR